MASHVPPSGSGGGIVRYTVELARALHRRPDVDLHLLTTAKAFSLASRGMGRVVRLPPIPDAAVPPFERWALGHVLENRFDVVQGTKHLLPQGVRARTALTVHDMLLLDRPTDFGPAKRRLLRRPYLSSMRQADTLLCVSAATRDRVASWDPTLLAKTAVVPLATGQTLRESDAVPVAALAGRRFALVVGDDSPRKNLAVVMSAWARVVEREPQAVLAQVGPPSWGRSSYGPAYESLLASGHLLRLVGVDDGVLRWCYENAAVVLAPSLAEGFGLPAAEALDFGTALVTSTDPALCEVSGDGADHLPPHDVAAWADAITGHLARSRHDGRHPISPRNWDEVAEETVAAVLG